MAADSEWLLSPKVVLAGTHLHSDGSRSSNPGFHPPWKRKDQPGSGASMQRLWNFPSNFSHCPISGELLPRSHEPVAGWNPQNVRSGRIRMKVQVTPILFK